MGYKVLLIIGRDTKQVCEDLTYFTVAATLDLGKASRSHLLLLPWENSATYPEQWEFFNPIGEPDTSITEDRLGQYFKPIPIDDVITALEKDIRRDNYRPAAWALALLNKMQEDSITDEAFSVMLYAH